jgi:hypothetical protein
MAASSLLAHVALTPGERNRRFLKLAAEWHAEETAAEAAWSAAESLSLREAVEDALRHASGS